jgi:DNA adenine methylase
MRYPGGKGGPGVFQTLINLMPQHDVYIESHAGGANIAERKKPAAQNILIDIDPAVTAKLAMRYQYDKAFTVKNGDAGQVLKSYEFTGKELVYSDPPYLMSTRKSGKMYRHEMTDEQHEELLHVLTSLNAFVMVSGYRAPLYEAMLQSWQRIDFKAMTRGGPSIESVWMNFQPVRLHDHSHLGSNFREREQIKRKQKRWRERLLKMDQAERRAMLETLLEVERDLSPSFLTISDRGIH